MRGLVDGVAMETTISREDLLRGDPDVDRKKKRLRRVLLEQYDMRKAEEFGDLLGDMDED